MGSKINGEPKLATQLPKGCMILCVKKHFHKVLYVLARGGDNDDFYWKSLIFIIFQTGPHWNSLGYNIDGKLKLATQLPKGDTILGNKKYFQKLLYIQARGG